MATILLADDHPCILRLLERTLADQGHTLLSAADGACALHLAATRRPDLAILDITMPKLDGLSVLDHIRRDPALRTMTVILLSVWDEPASISLGLGAGADFYLTKPFRPAELQALVRRIVENRPPTPPEPALGMHPTSGA